MSFDDPKQCYVRFNITLDDVKPAVLRRVEVPFDIRLAAPDPARALHALADHYDGELRAAVMPRAA